METPAAVLAPPSASLAPLTCHCGKPVIARGLCQTHYKQGQRSKAFAPLAVQDTSSGPSTLERNAGSLRQAARKLSRLAPSFVDILYTAAKNAAAKGDAGPSQWALLHSRAIAPLITGPSSDKGQLTVNVGVRVSGTETAQGVSVKAT